MRFFSAMLMVAVLYSFAVSADTRITRDDVNMGAVQCGDYGMLQRGQWNECMIRITTKSDLRNVALTVRIRETGYSHTTLLFDIRARDNARQSGNKRDFDIATTRLVTFLLPKTHPTGEFLLETRLNAGAVRRVKILPQNLAFSAAVYRPVTVR